MEYAADLHIHSKYSIAVSQSLNLDTMTETCKKKGINILGTGDITQPDWRRYLQDNLVRKDACYFYQDVAFIPQTEIEDEDSIHHVVFLPTLEAGERLASKLALVTKDLEGRWAGRVHVHLSAQELVELIDEIGGVMGPAHAFTPYKSVFRQGKFADLKACFGASIKKVPFLELGLSANTQLADRIECLQNITFLSNSDAHSQHPVSLGREFNRIEMDSPSFEELLDALWKKNGRRITLNVGLDPRLGKYFVMYCNKCRRRVVHTIDANSKVIIDGKENISSDQDFIRILFKKKHQYQEFVDKVAKSEIPCPLCAQEYLNPKKKASKSTQGSLFDFVAKNEKKPAGNLDLASIPKSYRLRLGVSERVAELSSWDQPHSPDHRPNYLNIIPLAEILRSIVGVKGIDTKSVMQPYEKLIQKYGTEYAILVDLPPGEFADYFDGKLSAIITAFRNGTIEFTPGGGGSFGEINFNAT